MAKLPLWTTAYLPIKQISQRPRNYKKQLVHRSKSRKRLRNMLTKNTQKQLMSGTILAKTMDGVLGLRIKTKHCLLVVL